MVPLIVLFWILTSSHCVHGQDQVFQAMHNAVDQVLTDVNYEPNDPIHIYGAELFDLLNSVKPQSSRALILENTSTSLYLLDISRADQRYEIENLVGFPLSYLLNSAGLPLQQISDMNMLHVCCNTGVSFGYNISIADSSNGTIIESITTDKYRGTTLRSRIPDKVSQFLHVKKMMLTNIPFTELTVEGFKRFPGLESLLLQDIPIAHMENGLLCYNVNITILLYINSQGYLTSFPSQIFNCASPLKLEYIFLSDHNIAYLPAYAFGNATEQLIIVILNNIGLEVIHQDAFKGLTSVHILVIRENKLSQIPDAELLPFSTNLRMLQILAYRYTGGLNLTAMGIRQNHLKLFHWKSNYISDLSGNFCSNQSHSELTNIIFQSNSSMTETLAVDTFDHCVSLKYLAVGYNGFVYLPERLFATNVSKVEVLLLMGNKLNSNTSWSDVLKPLHELKYLNLSANRLTSWTDNLSSLWRLEILDLSHNSITRVSHTAFINMTVLNLLSLENNSLAFLTPKVQGVFSDIPLLYLGSNNISQLNMSLYTMANGTIILHLPANSLTQLDLPLMKTCNPECGKISLFGDDNYLSSFLLPCSNSQQYATVSLTNNWLTKFLSIFPELFVQQCSIEVLNVSGNYFTSWDIPDHNTWATIMKDQMINKETFTHKIKTLDMTHCGMEYIRPTAFHFFTIEFLDLRNNLLATVPIIHEGNPYPSALDIRFNPLMCDCSTLWLKQHFQKNTFIANKKFRLSNCIDIIWHKPVNFHTVPESLFICEIDCPHQIEQQCNKEHRCYGTNLELDAVVCLSSDNNGNLSSAFIPAAYQLHVSGFNLQTLGLPYAESTGLTHLNLTSCNISVIPETAFINTSRLELLVLADNAIQTLAIVTFHPLVWLKYLDLSNNQLMFFHSEIFLTLRRVQILYLHGNNLRQLSLTTLQEFETVLNISLHDNPWICNCNDTFGHWIVAQQRKGIFLSPENITCGGTDVPVMYSNMTCTTHTKVHVHHGSKAATVVSSVLASVLVVTLVICSLIYKYRFTLSVLFFIYMPRCRRRAEHDGVPGVFAIYDDQERGARVWIKDSLIPFIESACPLICYDRDFIIGEDMADNIQNAVEQSNCAIVLLSRRFMQNSWSCCMFQAAFSEMRERKRPYKIILILTPDVTVNMLTSDENCPQDLRVMLKTQRLVYMSQKLYHETLLYLLPNSCKTTQQFMAIRGEDTFTLKAVTYITY